ncbi:MipA/OmpV family protein [Psychrilyobacter sp.]|uniref:MipA/OmpV family protein n=1 Tax=Psychrilyobacter sp. TaxID=2586924 RepID=UPI0030191847
MIKKRSEENYKISLGFMGGYGSKLYKVHGKNTRYVPIVGLVSKNFYILGTELGYKKELNSKISITGFSQLFGGVSLQGIGGTQLNNSDMEKGYKGINDRKTQIEFGFRLGYETKYQDIKLLTELRGGERGNSGKISVIKPIFVTKKLLIIPQINLTLLDSDMVDYYFGITEDEVNNPKNTKLNKIYNPNDFEFASSMGLTAKYNFTSKWSAFTIAEIQYIGSEVGDSPIVNSRTNYFIGLGLRYDF